MNNAAASLGDPRAAITPLVTIAMPVFNAGRHLRAAVHSIKWQTFEDWELLLLDDGSTDGSLQTIEDLMDARIRILHDGENRGISARLNQAIDMARGNYLARMDGDDISHPYRLASQLAALQCDASIDLLATRTVTIDDGNRLVGELPWMGEHEGICSRPWLGFHFPHPSWMGKMEWFRRHRYRMPAPYRCEDQELLLRTHGTSKFHALNESLLAYRLRERPDREALQMTHRALWRVQQEYLRANRLWLSMALSTAAFIGRCARLHCTTTGLSGARSHSAPAPSHRAWTSLLADIHSA